MPGTDDAAAESGAGLRARVPMVALRVVQFALDLAIVAMMTLVPVGMALLLLPHNPDGTLGALLITIPVVVAVLVVAVVLSWWYWARLPLRRGGRTLVMGWFRLRVVGIDGGEATGSQLTLRWLLLVVDAMFLGAVAVVAMLSTSRTQRVGDSMSDTVVVRDGPT